MRIKKVLSMLLVFSILIGLMPPVSLAADSDNAAPRYHLFTNLPTAENSVITGDLRLGEMIAGQFYGLSGMSSVPAGGSVRSFPGSGDDAEMCKISVQYGGTHETFGEYYYVIFTLKNGKSYALSYASGYIAQNEIKANGEPTDGWQDKNRMYFDEQSQTFYRAFVSNGDTVTKGLKISTSSHNIFTEKLSNLRVANSEYLPVRLYEVCKSNNVAGSNDTHKWSGSCTCGYKFDYRDKNAPDDEPEEEPVEELNLGYHQTAQLPTAENPVISGDLRLGAAIAGKFYGLSGMSSVPEGGSVRSFPGSDEAAEMCKISVQYGGTHEDFGEY